jgi:hypothetical protein
VSKYRAPNIRPLEAPARDAKAVGRLFVERGGVHERNCLVLTDEEVTREKVRDIFCNVLPYLTKPGDEIFIFWSGHGGRMSSTRSDRLTNPHINYLVPYDGRTDNPENTMLTEGPFGQWIQKLCGRKVYFIIDACYSGGMASRAKSLEDDELNEDDIAFPFLFTDFARAKSLGQTGLAVLASSTTDQISWERADGRLSVMTHFFIETIKNGPRNMTHKDIKLPVRNAVTQYVRQHYPRAIQMVVEQDDLTPGLRLKP